MAFMTYQVSGKDKQKKEKRRGCLCTMKQFTYTEDEWKGQTSREMNTVDKKDERRVVANLGKPRRGTKPLV